MAKSSGVLVLKRGKLYKGKFKEQPDWFGKKIRCNGDIVGQGGCGCVFIIVNKRKVRARFSHDSDGSGFVFNDYVKCPECKKDIHLGEWCTNPGPHPD